MGSGPIYGLKAGLPGHAPRPACFLPDYILYPVNLPINSL